MLLDQEKQIIIECRALLNSYDDFMFGLRGNQLLYEELERAFEAKRSALNAAYEEKVRRLLAIAEEKGLLKEFVTEAKLLEEK